MSVTIEPLECGWLTAAAESFEEGAGDEPLRIPIAVWLVRHPRGELVFDTGLHPELAVSTDRIGGLAKVFTADMAPERSLGARLRAADVDPDRLRCVVLSHLHFDHAGGLCEVPNAEVVVQSAEWDAGRADDAKRFGYRAADYDLGHGLRLVDGDHDVFGDGAVTCLATPGHTAGHQSLRVVTDDGPVVLTADACYFAHTLDRGVLPPFAHDHDTQRRSLQRLVDERAGGARVLAGHDPVQFAALPARLG
ncbi:MAG: N-acyl homoserine lactonase family protein [Actinomycetota bacterium]|nr:N-acyl homoserine lactonase family protein [Actinomycetota bacterium]